MNPTRRAWLMLALAVGGPAVALLAPLPKGTRLLGVFLNLGHVVLGVFVCILLWLALKRLTRTGHLARAAWAWLGAMALLSSIEAFQAFSKTRAPTLDDFVGNGLGATAALLFVLASRQPLWRRIAIAAIPLLLALIPTGLQVYDTIQQRRAFPVLCDFDSRLELTRWLFRSSSATAVEDGGRSTLRVDFKTRDAWPAAMFAYVALDWRGYQTLAFDVRSDAPRELLMLVVDAQYDGTYADRYTRTLALSASWQTFRIPLAEIAEGPQGRTLDLSEVHSMQWFADHPQQPFPIWLDAIRLERAP